jgi:predicted Fe-Mo cluster-binding NifX family protein
MVAALVLLLPVLVVLSVWPVGAVSPAPKTSPDIVAIPATGAELSSPVHPVFGRAPQFLVLDLRTDRSRWVKNPLATAKHAVGQDVTHLLAREQVGTVVARRIGPEAFRRLETHGIRVLGGQPTTVEDTIRRLSGGGLTPLTRPTGQLHDGLNYYAQPAASQAGPERRAQVPLNAVQGLGIGIAPTASSGALVTSVTRGSSAETAGLRVGDVVLECNHTAVASAAHLKRLIASVGTGHVARLTVLRNGRAEAMSVVKRDGLLRGATW